MTDFRSSATWTAAGTFGFATANANGIRRLCGGSESAENDCLYVSWELNSSKRITARPEAIDLDEVNE